MNYDTTSPVEDSHYMCPLQYIFYLFFEILHKMSSFLLQIPLETAFEVASSYLWSLKYIKLTSLLFKV